jgi:hypothetical protein
LQVTWLLYWHIGPLDPTKQEQDPLPLMPSLQVPLPEQTCPPLLGHCAQFGP